MRIKATFSLGQPTGGDCIVDLAAAGNRIRLAGEKTRSSGHGRRRQPPVQLSTRRLIRAVRTSRAKGLVRTSVPGRAAWRR